MFVAWTGTVRDRFTDQMPVLPRWSGPRAGAGDGGRRHDVRPARAGPHGRIDRPAGRRRCGLAAAGLGRSAPLGAGPATARGLHPVRAAHLRTAGGGHGRGDAAVHGRAGAPAARHGSSPGVPRPPRRGGGSRGWQAVGLAGLSRCRRAAAHAAMARRGRSRRRGVRAGGSLLLGGVHPADPARRSGGPGGTAHSRSPCPSQPWSPPRSPGPRPCRC